MLGSGRIRGRGSGSKEESIPVLQVRFIDRHQIQMRCRSSAIASLCFVFCSNPGENCRLLSQKKSKKGDKGSRAERDLGVEYHQYGFDMQFLRRYGSLCPLTNRYLFLDKGFGA